MATHTSILAWKIPWTVEPVGYSPWGLKESDRTERLHLHFSFAYSEGPPGGAKWYKELPCQCRRHEMWVPSLSWEDPLETEMATRSSILAWEIPRTRSLVGYSPWGHKETATTAIICISLTNLKLVCQLI